MFKELAHGLFQACSIARLLMTA